MGRLFSFSFFAFSCPDILWIGQYTEKIFARYFVEKDIIAYTHTVTIGAHAFDFVTVSNEIENKMFYSLQRHLGNKIH